MSMKSQLKGFINLLNEHVGFDFNINNFDDRLKLQKYVFIGKFFGFNHDYHYNLYIRGPYSSDLADDYYDIYRENVELILPNDIDVNSFFLLIQGKTIDWLESAATMLSLYESNKKKYYKYNSKRLINGTSRIKHKISSDIIGKVYNDLNENGLFN